MLYGPGKTRSIARSVLPSTRRKGARDELASIKRRNRHSVRTYLSQVADDPEWFFDRDKFDPNYYPDEQIMEVVWERRSGDKLGALMRWAPKATAHLGDDADARYYYVRDLLPKDLSGRHAMTHITNLEEFDMRYEHDGRYRYSEYAAQNTKTARKARYEAIRQERIDLLRQAVRDVRHGEINSVIKKAHVPTHYIRGTGRARIQAPERWEQCDDCHNPRTFGGWHDIEAFVDHVHASRHDEVRDALKSIGLWT